MKTGRYVLCPTCFAKVKSVYGALMRHHVSDDMVRQLILDPTCPICKRDVLRPQRNKRGEWQVMMVVDHDHSCCPGRASCGRCVRACICGPCNLALGHVDHDARIAHALGDYLSGHITGAGSGVHEIA